MKVLPEPADALYIEKAVLFTGKPVIEDYVRQRMSETYFLIKNLINKFGIKLILIF